MLPLSLSLAPEKLQYSWPRPLPFIETVLLALLFLLRFIHHKLPPLCSFCCCLQRSRRHAMAYRRSSFPVPISFSILLHMIANWCNRAGLPLDPAALDRERPSLILVFLSSAVEEDFLRSFGRPRVQGQRRRSNSSSSRRNSRRNKRCCRHTPPPNKQACFAQIRPAGGREDGKVRLNRIFTGKDCFPLRVYPPFGAGSNPSS